MGGKINYWLTGLASTPLPRSSRRSRFPPVPPPLLTMALTLLVSSWLLWPAHTKLHTTSLTRPNWQGAASAPIHSRPSTLHRFASGRAGLLALFVAIAGVAWPEQSTPHDLLPCPDPCPRLVRFEGLGVGHVRLASPFRKNVGVLGVQFLLRLLRWRRDDGVGRGEASS